MKIIPAILEREFDEIQNKLNFFSEIKKKYNLDFDLIQIDFCDGKFVENETWLPTNISDKETETILSYKNIFDIEYHLMCEDQYKYFSLLKRLKAKSIVIHIDNIFDNILNQNILTDIISDAEENFINIKICSRLDFIKNHEEHIKDFLKSHKNINLQIMGINKIGSQGQDFDERCLGIIKDFRKVFEAKDLSIQIDGSMNTETISLVKKAGADAAIVGSFLVKNLSEVNFVVNFRNIKKL